MSPPTPDSASRPGASAATSPTDSLTILLVDDDADLRLVIRTALEDETPHVLVEEPDGLLAWDYVRTYAVPLIIVCDHQMPYLDGPGLLSFIRDDPAIAQRVAPIYLTASSRVIAPAFQQLLDELHVPVMRKPFDIEALLAAIAAAAGRLRRQALVAPTAPTAPREAGRAEPRRAKRKRASKVVENQAPTQAARSDAREDSSGKPDGAPEKEPGASPLEG